MYENHPDDNQKPVPVQPRTTDSSFPEQLRFFTTPLTQRGWPRWLVFVMALIGLVYIMNPTLGILELLPDNLPFVGNLDEGVAILLLWYGLVEFFQGKQKDQPDL